MSSGFKKINVIETMKDKKGKSKKKHPFLKVVGIVLGIVVVLLLVLGVVVYSPAKALYLSAQKTARIGKELATAAKSQDLETSDTKLKELEESLGVMQGDLNKILFLKAIPFVGGYVSDADHFLKAGIASTQAGKISVETILPYSDLLGLKGKSTFVSGSADDRIKTAVEAFDKITPDIDKIGDKIAIADRELEQIDIDKYPAKIGNTVVRERLKTGKDLFKNTASLFVEAQPLLKKLPELMGVRESKRYLVLFQNDAELRATGGFITAYGIFSIDKGKIKVDKADDIYKLDESKNKKFPAPRPLLKYHVNVTNLELRDSNLSPDYEVSMKELRDMITESIPGFPKYDGIIALDTHVLVSTIKILGDFNVYGRTFSADIDKRCDCAKAIYELEDYSSKPVAYVREDRKDIISVLMYQIMQRALGVSPSKYWGKLMQTILQETQEKHVLFYFDNADAQKGIEALNFGGRIQSTDGDYLHISNVNLAGAKSNLFVKTSVKQDIQIGGDGTVTETVTISYKNPSPPSNCNLEAGQLCLNGILRNWVRLYVPQGATLVEFKGSEKETVTYDELGKTVFEGFMTVKPQGSAEVSVKYKLPKKAQGSPYKLLIQKQPGTDNPEYSILINGREKAKIPLLTDQTLTLKY